MKTTALSLTAIGLALRRWELNNSLDELQSKIGLDIPIHVDGASGGFVAPFLQPDLEWDFRVPRVQSINTSGHKYGLVYPGIGWIIWRNKKALSEELIFYVNYLGGEMPTFAINFSRPGNYVLAQYYNFLRLGEEGYQRIHQSCQDIALYLSGKIAKLGTFELISNGDDIPVFAFKLKDELVKNGNYTVFDISERLRLRGWQVPAYTFPKNCEHIAALRVVVKEGFSRDLADLLLDDMRSNKKALSEELIFYVNYLGGEMPTFAINFSRPGNYVLAQYYNFLRLGEEGYQRIHQSCQDIALYLSGKIAKLGTFELISNGDDIPVFAFKLKDELVKNGNYTVFDISERLRLRGWQVPAYTFPKNCEHIAALRVVVKEGFSRDLADMLLDDMRSNIEWFDAHPNHEPTRSGTNFSH